VRNHALHYHLTHRVARVLMSGDTKDAEALAAPVQPQTICLYTGSLVTHVPGSRSLDALTRAPFAYTSCPRVHESCRASRIDTNMSRIDFVLQAPRRGNRVSTDVYLLMIEIPPRGTKSVPVIAELRRRDGNYDQPDLHSRFKTALSPIEHRGCC